MCTAVEEVLTTPEFQEPFSVDALVDRVREHDPMQSRRTVISTLRDLGYTSRCIPVEGGCGKANRWACNEDWETRPKTPRKRTEDAPESLESSDVDKYTSTVEERNDALQDANTRLLQTLKISKDLKAEMMKKQQEALAEMARSILSIFGTDEERIKYNPLA
jgi:hypothetical protein